MNPNVRLILIYTALYQAAQSVAFTDMLSAYVFRLTQSNQAVGYVAGVNGVIQILFAIPVGMFADRYRRDSVLKCAGTLGIIGLAVAFATYLLALPLPYIYLVVALWGCQTAISNPSLESLFADSVPGGRRSHIFAVKHAVMQFSAGAGPILSICLFLLVGNDWEPSQTTRRCARGRPQRRRGLSCSK